MNTEQEIKILNSQLKALKNQNKKLRILIDEASQLNLTIVLLEVYRCMMGNKPLPFVQILVKSISDYVFGAKQNKIVQSDEIRVEQKNKLEYVTSVLHYYYCLAYPDYFYDTPLKKNIGGNNGLSCKNLLEIALNNFSRAQIKSSNLQNAIENELNKPLPPYSIQSWTAKPHMYKLEYREFLRSIYEGIKTLYQRVNLKIDERFLIEEMINTSHSREVLNRIFNVMKDFELLSETERSKFLSMFSTTINATEGKIEWKDINEKNDGISFQSLCIIFSELYNFDNKYKYNNQKSVIAGFFVYRNNDDELIPVTSEKLRLRKTISSKNDELRNRIVELLESFYGTIKK